MELTKPARRCWHAAYTRSRHENRVAHQLRLKGLEFLLPTYHRLIRWSDRVMRSPAPLFPGYVFVCASDRERIRVLETAGVVYLVSTGGSPVTLSDFDIEQLRTCSLRSNDVQPHPCLRIGQRVRVKHGPFAGWEGRLVEKQNSRRLVITIERIMRSVSVNLYGVDVDPIGDYAFAPGHASVACATHLNP
jgi:transcription antitermination factor NusG